MGHVDQLADHRGDRCAAHGPGSTPSISEIDLLLRPKGGQYCYPEFQFEQRWTETQRQNWQPVQTVA
jgi:hypothetical protein